MLKILIVDDSLIIQKKLKRIFENLGHNVISCASNGEKALFDYIKYKPDLVTMDITMPIMDGISAVKSIINEDSNAKIIMVTSHGQENMVVRSIEAGAMSYILKPVTEDKLIQVINDIFIEN